MTTKLLLLLCFVAAWAAANSSSHNNNNNAPSLPPSPTLAPGHSDCSSIIYNMASCVSYLSNDSKVTKPDKSCCSGLESVLDAGFVCVCTAVKSSSQMGLALNMSRANTLASACGVSAPPLSHCTASKPPVSPPKAAPSPSRPVSPSPSAPAKPPRAHQTPASSPGGGTPEVAPAPSILGGTHSISASFTFIISMLLVASFS